MVQAKAREQEGMQILLGSLDVISGVLQGGSGKVSGCAFKSTLEIDNNDGCASL